MSDFHVEPDALLAFGQGSQSLAEKFGALASLLEQARVDDQCFGPIGDAVGLSRGYFSSLEECQKLATDAQQFLQQANDALAESHATYQGVDDGLAQGFTALGNGLGGVTL